MPAAGDDGPRANLIYSLIFSGTILFEVMQAAEWLKGAGYPDIVCYSVKGYVELARNAASAEQAAATDADSA